MKNVCLLTGPPGCGKTTLIRQVIREYPGKACGFYTEEIREGDQRLGFRLITLDGNEVTLAHVDLGSPYRISKYGVNVDGFETIGVPSLLKTDRSSDLTIIDEIGKMEMLSLKFREVVSRLIGSGQKVLGTILLNHHAWSDVIKARPEVETLMLNSQNYTEVLTRVRHWLELPECLPRTGVLSMATPGPAAGRISLPWRSR